MTTFNQMMEDMQAANVQYQMLMNLEYVSYDYCPVVTGMCSNTMFCSACPELNKLNNKEEVKMMNINNQFEMLMGEVAEDYCPIVNDMCDNHRCTTCLDMALYNTDYSILPVADEFEITPVVAPVITPTAGLSKMKKAELINELTMARERYDNLYEAHSEMSHDYFTLVNDESDYCDTCDVVAGLETRIDNAIQVYKEQEAVIAALRQSLLIACNNNTAKMSAVMNNVLKNAPAVNQELIKSYSARNAKPAPAPQTQVTVPPVVTIETVEPVYTEQPWMINSIIKFQGKKKGTAVIPVVDATCPICGKNGIPIDEANYSHRKFVPGTAICAHCQKAIRDANFIPQIKALVTSSTHTDSIVNVIKAALNINQAPVVAEIVGQSNTSLDNVRQAQDAGVDISDMKF